MRRLLIFLLLVAACYGCSPKVIPVQSHTETVRTEIVRDTVTKVVQDSSLVRILLESDSLGRIRIAELQTENGRLVRQNTTLRGNILEVTARAESEERVRERIVTDTVRHYVEVPVPYPEVREVNRTRWWQRILMWAGAYFIVRSAVRIGLNWKQLTFKTLLKILL